MGVYLEPGEISEAFNFECYLKTRGAGYDIGYVKVIGVMLFPALFVVCAEILLLINQNFEYLKTAL